MAKTTRKPIKTQIYIKSLKYIEQVKTCVLCDSVKTLRTYRAPIEQVRSQSLISIVLLISSLL